MGLYLLLLLCVAYRVNVPPFNTSTILGQPTRTAHQSPYSDRVCGCVPVNDWALMVQTQQHPSDIVVV